LPYILGAIFVIGGVSYSTITRVNRRKKLVTN
jgi:hypothetical protein